MSQFDASREIRRRLGSPEFGRVRRNVAEIDDEIRRRRREGEQATPEQIERRNNARREFATLRRGTIRGVTERDDVQRGFAEGRQRLRSQLGELGGDQISQSIRDENRTRARIAELRRMGQSQTTAGGSVANQFQQLGSLTGGDPVAAGQNFGLLRPPENPAIISRLESNAQAQGRRTGDLQRRFGGLDPEGSIPEPTAQEGIARAQESDRLITDAGRIRDRVAQELDAERQLEGERERFNIELERAARNQALQQVGAIDPPRPTRFDNLETVEDFQEAAEGIGAGLGDLAVTAQQRSRSIAESRDIADGVEVMASQALGDVDDLKRLFRSNPQQARLLAGSALSRMGNVNQMLSELDERIANSRREIQDATADIRGRGGLRGLPARFLGQGPLDIATGLLNEIGVDSVTPSSTDNAERLQRATIQLESLENARRSLAAARDELLGIVSGRGGTQRR